MNEIDQAIAEARARLAKLDEQINDLSAAMNALQFAKAAVEGEIRGLEKAKEFLFAEPQPEAAPRERHAVQRVIMGLFDGPLAPFTEAEIITASSLPAASTHTFLLRAVRAGTLFEKAGVYYKHKPADEDQPA